jgi:endoplasmic reticulum Man9GlcNAc2 1,2-alpha-mannosidase
MLLMHQHEEYARARKWVEEKLDFNVDGIYNVFEVRRPVFTAMSVITQTSQTTIRVLGGLLSAYHLSSHDDLYLTKAVDLADRLMVAFVTPSGLPTSMVNLGKREAIPDTQNNNRVSTAEVATLQLEFRYLSEITGDDTYWRAAENVRLLVEPLLHLSQPRIGHESH